MQDTIFVAFVADMEDGLLNVVSYHSTLTGAFKALESAYGGSISWIRSGGDGLSMFVGDDGNRPFDEHRRMPSDYSITEYTLLP